MTYTQQAIEKAVIAGWEPRFARTEIVKSFPDKNMVRVFDDYHFLLDPDFWRALMGDTSLSWYSEMHRLVDHIADGSDIESFFKQLFKQLLTNE